MNTLHEKAINIRKAYTEGSTKDEIARVFSINRQLVCMIIAADAVKQEWGDIPPEVPHLSDAPDRLVYSTDPVY
jgi:hypothetical protein